MSCTVERCVWLKLNAACAHGPFAAIGDHCPPVAMRLGPSHHWRPAKPAPCPPSVLVIFPDLACFDSGYRDIWSCLAHFWVQIFSNHGFADVQGTVSIFRGGVLVHELQLPAAEQPDSFWIGFVLETLRILRLICYYGFLVSQLLSHFLRCGGQGLGQQHHPILL